MTKSTSLDPHSEVELQRKIAAGSRDAKDYSRLADLLVNAGRYDEAVSLYHQELNLPLANLQRAKVSVDLGWLLYERGQQSRALPLARSAIELLSQESESAELLFLRGLSWSLLAHCLWFTDEKSGADAAHSALRCLDRLI